MENDNSLPTKYMEWNESQNKKSFPCFFVGIMSQSLIIISILKYQALANSETFRFWDHLFVNSIR